MPVDPSPQPPWLALSPAAGEEVAKCPSCSLYVRVIYDPADFQEQPTEGGQAA